MKIQSKMPVTFAGFLLVFMSALICAAQPRVGGYRDVSKTDATVKLAAQYAVDQHSNDISDDTLEFVSVVSAKRQIVQGSNYQMCLAVRSNGKSQQAEATVYQDLQNQFSLTEWVEGCAGTEPTEPEAEIEAANETNTFKGQLNVGKTVSSILYVGEESGDYAAFCFMNTSAVGRQILKTCKNGAQCEFTGEIDYEKACQVAGLEADLSAAGTITKLDSVKSSAAKSKKSKKRTKSKKSLAVAPNVLVAQLYASEKKGTNPFFQTKKRALLDKFFTKDFADLIWNDAKNTPEGEVGVLDFDPLYNAQDTKITIFRIGKPVYDPNSEKATVAVSFKNYGKVEKIKFLLEKESAGIWKISDIAYKSGAMLKGMFAASTTQTK